MTEDTEEKPVRKRKPKAQVFINASTHNAFTSKGRVAPQQKVTLMPEEAEQHNGKLKRC